MQTGQALEIFQSVAQHVNESIHLAEAVQDVLRIQSQFIGDRVCFT